MSTVIDVALIEETLSPILVSPYRSSRFILWWLI